MAKYIVVCGGVISGTGKGVSIASLGLLLALRGLKVVPIKFDPYLNTNAGVLAPREHGEVFLCDDGSETDLDLGTYERIINCQVSSKNILTSGTVYKEIIEEQDQGKYLGQTVQIVPHVTDKIIGRLLDLGKDADIVLVEIGGTVGDAESYTFLEAVRQFKQRNWNDVLITLVAPVLWVPTIKEFKTKPLQQAVQCMQSNGLQPEVLFCRTDRDIPKGILEKISNLTNVSRSSVFEAPDVKSVYQVPIEFYNRHVDDLVIDKFHLTRNGVRIHKYRDLVEKYVNSDDLQTVRIAVLNKYDNCDEAYLSLKEAIFHAAVAKNVKAEIVWINADEVEACRDLKCVAKLVENIDGMIVPGGFDVRGVEGKIKGIKYVRENKVPFLGICLGLQCAVIEFARFVGWEDATSEEFNTNTKHPVVHYIPGQEKITKKSGTMRLGSYSCELAKDSIAYEWYKKKIIHERHRHRYEVNNELVSLESFKNKGFHVTGRNPDTGLIEIMELERSIHPYFVGTQAHPELKSRLMGASPLFVGLIENSLKKKFENINRNDG